MTTIHHPQIVRVVVLQRWTHRGNLCLYNEHWNHLLDQSTGAEHLNEAMHPAQFHPDLMIEHRNFPTLPVV